MPQPYSKKTIGDLLPLFADEVKNIEKELQRVFQTKDVFSHGWWRAMDQLLAETARYSHLEALSFTLGKAKSDVH